MDLSLYIHIPYCDSKCPYCDFNSHAVRRWPEARYVDALRRELEHAAARPQWRKRVGTIFFGGGTPSLFSPRSIASLLDDVAAAWVVDEAAEVTIETNPGTVDRAKLAGFREAGVNRISFGVQSFDDDLLVTLGRIHDGATAVRAVGDAQAAGFDDVNVDLIFAVPGQTVAGWRRDLDRAITLGTTHVSAYNLTFEEGTAFHAMRARGELRQLPEDIEVEMYEATGSALAGAGFERYEISNYARPGRECRHNLAYWRLRPYLGVGAGAHSFAPELGLRASNERGPEKYMTDVEQRGDAHATSEELCDRQLQGEFAFLGLRCLDGIDAREFESRFGSSLCAAFPQCEGLRDRSLLEEDDGRWRLSRRGLMVADEVFATFV